MSKKMKSINSLMKKIVKLRKKLKKIRRILNICCNSKLERKASNILFKIKDLEDKMSDCPKWFRRHCMSPDSPDKDQDCKKKVTPTANW